METVFFRKIRRKGERGWRGFLMRFYDSNCVLVLAIDWVE